MEQCFNAQRSAASESVNHIVRRLLQVKNPDMRIQALINVLQRFRVLFFRMKAFRKEGLDNLKAAYTTPW